MERLTIRVPEDLLEEIERITDADGVSQSEAARQLLRRGSEYERIHNERDRLERQLSAVNARQGDVDELVEYVESQRDLERRRAYREERRSQAGVLTRTKWWLTGMPAEKK